MTKEIFTLIIFGWWTVSSIKKNCRFMPILFSSILPGTWRYLWRRGNLSSSLPGSKNRFWVSPTNGRDTEVTPAGLQTFVYTIPVSWLSMKTTCCFSCNDLFISFAYWQTANAWGMRIKYMHRLLSLGCCVLSWYILFLLPLFHFPPLLFYLTQCGPGEVKVGLDDFYLK